MIKASEIEEIEKLGVMRNVVELMENNSPNDENIRIIWRKAIKKVNKALLKQWNLVDENYMSEDDT